RPGGRGSGLVQLPPGGPGRPNLCARGAQRGDRGHAAERRLPLAESFGFPGDDRFCALSLPPPARERFRDDGLDVVDVVEVAAVELVDGRVQVARYRQVDEEQRPTLAERENALDLLAFED